MRSVPVQPRAHAGPSAADRDDQQGLDERRDAIIVSVSGT